jgi:hypothetical protein
MARLVWLCFDSLSDWLGVHYRNRVLNTGLQDHILQHSQIKTNETKYGNNGTEQNDDYFRTHILAGVSNLNKREHLQLHPIVKAHLMPSKSIEKQPD